MKNLFKNIDLGSIAKTFILFPIILFVAVFFILYLINVLKNKNLLYLNAFLKVLGCYYAVIISSLLALFTIRLKYGDIIFFKSTEFDTFSAFSMFFISTFFLLLIYLFANFLKLILLKASLVKSRTLSIYSVLNPITYFILVFIFIFSLFIMQNNGRFNSTKFKKNIQKTSAIRIKE
jgi:hypothetical protein